MKKKIAILLAALMLIPAIAACGNSSGKGQDAAANNNASAPEESTGEASSDVNWDEIDPVELIVSSTKNENADAALVAFTERITERTQGKVTFSFYWGGSLVAAPEVVNGLQAGTCDMAQVNVSNFENLFPLNCNALAIPFMGMSAETTEIYPELAAKYPELSAEFEAQSLQLIGYSMSSPYNIFINSKSEIKTPADLSGSKLVCLQQTIMSFLSSNNCAPVQASFADFYTSIQGGVADGIVQNSGVINQQGITDLVNQELIFGENSGMYVELVTYCMNKDKWDSLPQAVQQVFEEESVQFHQDDQALQNGHANKQKEAAEAAGHRYWVMTEEEMQPWKDALAPFIQTKIDEISAMDGCENFKTIYEDALTMIAEKKGE